MSDETRDRLVEAAYRLILLKGFGSTRVDEICQAAGASKGSFYHCFKSKEAMGLAVFDHYYQSVWARLISGPYVTEPKPTRRLNGFLNHSRSLIPELLKGGSLLTTLAVELPAYSEDFAKMVRERTDLLVVEIADTLEGLVLPESITSHNELAFLYLSMMEGAVTMAVLMEKADLVETAISVFRSFALREEK